MKLASFDIFDTVLIRKCGKPENIFRLLAKKLYPDDADKRADFVAWRNRAPLNVARKIKKTELTIRDIYNDENAEAFGEYTRDELVKHETAVEKENLLPNPAVMDIMEQRRGNGWEIAFISDMYIDGCTLGEILRERGIAKESDKVFVSCDLQARKDSGLLYSKVREILHPDKWEHYGDNKHSDIVMARRNGIKAHRIDTAYNTTEQRIDKLSALPRLKELSLLAGLSRCARLINRNDPYAAIAADYVASAYIPFVSCILNKARNEGIKTLCFLSRDSYILQKIAEIMPHDDIELKYFYVSRRSLMRPYLHYAGEDGYMKIADRQTLVKRKIKDLLWQLQLDRKRLEKEYGIRFEYDRIKNREEERDFLDKIFHSKLTTHLENEGKREQELLSEYFKQEGITNGETCAMVDVGWLGTSRLMINEILARNGHTPVKYMYYGTRHDIYNGNNGIYSSYFESGRHTELTVLIENYYSASPYPTTIGYKKSENKILPVFPEGESVKFSKITDTNVAISQWIARETENYNITDETVLAIWANASLEQMAELPDDINLEPLIHCNDFGHEMVAKRLSVSEVLRYAFLGEIQTFFDRASVAYTCGFHIAGIINKLHSLARKIRVRVFNCYLKRSIKRQKQIAH